MKPTSVTATQLGTDLARSAFEHAAIPTASQGWFSDPDRVSVELFALNVFAAEYVVRLIWPKESKVGAEILESLYAEAVTHVEGGVAFLQQRSGFYAAALANLPASTSVGVHFVNTMLSALEERNLAGRGSLGIGLSNRMIAEKQFLEQLAVGL